MKLEGMGKVLANLNRAIAGIQGRTKQGTIKAGLLVKAESMRQTPHDTGNLKGSAYVDWNWGSGGSVGAPAFKGKSAERLSSEYSGARGAAKSEASGLGDMVVTIGYTAFYAPFVHEIQKNYRSGNWQFLRNALAENSGKILDIIRQEAKIPE
jgi:hypothetical protein